MPGLVVRYSYLWWHQSRRGQEEGRKDRPCAIVLIVRDDAGVRRVLLAPTTHSQPESPDRGVEIPLATKKRLGLDEQRSWIITDELNRFVWPGPDLRQRDDTAQFDYGILPAALFEQVKAQVRLNAHDHCEDGRSE